MIIKDCEDKDKIFNPTEINFTSNSIDIDKYITNRVKNKIDFFHCLMIRDKKLYEFMQVLIIVIGGLVAIVSSISNSVYSDILHPLTAVLGSLVVIFTGIAAFKKYQDRVINFKIALRSLEKELYLFLQRVGEYSENQNKDVKKIFVSRIEEILHKEALGYIDIMNQNRRDNEPNQNTTNSQDNNRAKTQ